MSTHLAVFKSQKSVDKILKGEKTVEIRFSQTRHVPYQSVKRGDVVMLKSAHGLIVGQVEIENVLYYDNLTPDMIANLRREHGKDSALTDDYWQKKSKARYATLIFLRSPERFIVPLKSPKKDRRPWAEIKIS